MIDPLIWVVWWLISIIWSYFLWKEVQKDQERADLQSFDEDLESVKWELQRWKNKLESTIDDIEEYLER